MNMFSYESIIKYTLFIQISLNTVEKCKHRKRFTNLFYFLSSICQSEKAFFFSFWLKYIDKIV